MYSTDYLILDITVDIEKRKAPLPNSIDAN